MSSSAIELTQRLAEEVEYSELVLNEGAVKGLFANQRDDMKMNVALANQAWKTSGAAIRACAACLNDIKENTPKGNWTALIKSGDLDFSESIAKDLVSAHQWLSASTIPDRFLANISARTLGTVSRINDPATKQKITEKIVETEGKGFSEKDLKGMLKISTGKPRAAGRKARKGLPNAATKEEAIIYYTKIINDMKSQLDTRDRQLKRAVSAANERLGRIAVLEQEIKDLKG